MMVKQGELHPREQDIICFLPSRYAYHPPLPPLFTLFVRHSLRNAVEDERSERMT